LFCVLRKMLRYVFCVLAVASAVAYARSLSAEEIKQFLDFHNSARDNVTIDFPNEAPASCIPHLVWDDWLAWHAQSYSDSCPAGHSHHAYQDGSSMGENLAWSYGVGDPIDTANRGWYEEYHDYHYEPVRRSDAVVGHYTQMMWARTVYVGCGWRDDCTSGWTTTKHNMITCNYWPAGNYVGQRPWTARNSGDPLPTCPAPEPDPPASPQCTSGFCCDLKTFTFRPSTFKCTNKKSVQGNCTGDSATCPGDDVPEDDSAPKSCGSWIPALFMVVLALLLC